MPTPAPTPPRPPDGPEPVELAALADGTLTGRRREELEREVAASPALRAALEVQLRALAAVRDEAPPAPDRLRARVDAERRRAMPAARRRRFGMAAGFAVVAAAAVLVVLFLLPAGVSGGTVIAEAAELAALPPTEPAPAAASRSLLALSQDGVPFPNYGPRFGWEAVGVRRDRLRGRDAVTVIYEKDGRRIGYTILSGALLDPPDEANRAAREGTLLRSFDRSGRRIVTWERGGLTCVISGRAVPRATLYDLAGWKGRGTVPF